MPRTLKSVSLKEAQKVTSVVINQASKDGGFPVAVAVVGIDGRLVALAAMDDVMPASIKLAQNKAYTALAGKRDTNYWEGKSSTFNPANFTDSSFTCFGGGVLLEVLSKEPKGPNQKLIIGAVGVSGRTSEQDHSLANRGKLELYC